MYKAITTRIVIGIILSLTFLYANSVIPATNAQITCDNLNPVGNSLDISLSDAELRTDQDFSCNFNARICPIIFVDTNNDGIRDSGEDAINGITITLSDPTETTTYYTEVTDAGENVCFEPLNQNTDYLVRVTTPPTPFNTTGGNTSSHSIATDSGIIAPVFGFSSGELTLTVPPTLVFPAQNTSSRPQSSTTTLSYAEVVDTRFTVPGWNVTATVEDFTSASSTIIPVSNAFTSTPGTVNIVTGNTNGLTPGTSYQVISPSDPFTLISASSSNGNGIYRIDDVFDLIVPSFTQSEIYTADIVFTII